jgi:hypothetical protein
MQRAKRHHSQSHEIMIRLYVVGASPIFKACGSNCIFLLLYFLLRFYPCLFSRGLESSEWTLMSS